MDNIINETITKLGRPAIELTDQIMQKIKALFPVPVEHIILWADVEFGRRISGLVVTDKGIFIKADSTLVKEYNASCDEKKEHVNYIYYYIKWNDFDVDDFSIGIVNGVKYLNFAGRNILKLNKERDFFTEYRSCMEKFIKESAVTASNIFADLEAVVPENFAAVNVKTGHGEMAEEALTLLDKLEGKDARVVGRTNTKNGADRIVNGIEIQCKYYSTGKGCIKACFDKETGLFRYQSSNGEPMLIEVPKDNYYEALEAFRNKILEGKVPGVTDPNDASKYIKQGRLTYKQALNLCKAGTIESLTYDTITGAITCSFAFGITFLTTFIISYAKNGEKKEALISAFAAGIQVFGLSFVTHVLTQQVARTTLTKQLVSMSDYIVRKMGYKAVQSIVNAIRSLAGKGAISGAAAMKQLSKILRSNVVTSAITFVVFSVPDTYSIFTKQISSAQYVKNMLSLIGSMAAAGGGTVAAALVTAKVGAAIGTTVNPLIGTAIGLAGGAAGGFIGGAVVKLAGDAIREDDSVIISRLFNGVVLNLIYEYMLSETETKVLLEKLDAVPPREMKKMVRKVMASNEQEKVIDDFIRKYFEEIIRSRPKIAEPSPEDLVTLFTPA